MCTRCVVASSLLANINGMLRWTVIDAGRNTCKVRRKRTLGNCPVEDAVVATAACLWRTTKIVFVLYVKSGRDRIILVVCSKMKILYVCMS